MAMKNECAAGLPNMIRLSPEQFRPRDVQTLVNGNKSAICHFCNQPTMVKQAEPRFGFFVQHASSQQGSAPGFSTGQSHGNKGTPPRVRKRGR